MREGEPTLSDAQLPARDSAIVESTFGAAEGVIYVVVAALLVVAAVFTTVGTIVDVVEGSDSRSITDTGIFILSRVLLMFIIAELLYTLRLVNFGARILVEPFLFIGLIAVVRRVLVITAEVERNPGRREITDFLIQVGALAGLALVLSLSIHLLRRSAGDQP
jgi:uncharacterized membrane protein (DUF373 family)